MLVKSIVTEVIEEQVATMDNFGGITAQVGLEDYAKVYGFVGFLQNFNKALDITDLPTLKMYGVSSNINKELVEIEISYINE